MRGTRTLAVAIAGLLATASTTAFAQTAPVAATPSQQTLSANPDSAAGPATLPILDWAVALGYEHTDNINRASVNPTNQDILQPTLNFTYTQQGTKLQAQVAGVVQYIDYLQSFYGNEFRGQLSGTLNWIIAPQRLNFVLQDYSSVEPVDIRASNAPSNQQQVNVLVAGPTLSFRMGTALRGEADLRYVNTVASETKDFNSRRGLAALRAIRDLNATAALSGNVEAVHVDFSNPDTLVNANGYDQYNAFVRYQSQLKEVGLDLAVGASRISFAEGAGDHSGSLVRAGIGWQMSARNSLSLNASNQLGDATADLIQSSARTDVNVTDLSVQVGRTDISPVVYRESSLNVTYKFQGPRFGFNLTPYYRRLRQLNGDDLSRDEYGTIAEVTYLIQPLMILGVSVDNDVAKYVAANNRDHDIGYTINLSRQFTPHWSWRVAFNHESRNSAASDLDYRANQLFVFLYYRR